MTAAEVAARAPRAAIVFRGARDPVAPPSAR
jgi:hypothetical protein